MTASSIQRSSYYLLLVGFAISSIVATAAGEFLWPEWRYVNVPLHAAIEASGGLSAVVIAVLLLQRHQEAQSAKWFPLAIGFFGMGLLDTLHAISVPGYGFVLLHGVGSFVGGSCFALLWLPDRWIAKLAVLKGWLFASVGVGAVVLGVWTLTARQTLPAMMLDGEFTAAAIALHVVAGAFFLGAAVRLLINFNRSERLNTYLLGCMAMMFGLAAVLFRYSALWDDTWWLWHGWRAAAYGFALVFAFREHYGTLTDLRGLLVTHEETMARLRNAETRYRTLYEQSPDGIVLIDPVTALPVDFNDAAARQLGYGRGEFAHLRIADYELIETPEEVSARIATIQKTGHASFETRHRTKQGDGRNVFVTVKTVELSGQSLMYAIFRDITHLREQAALARLGEMAAVVAHEVKNPLAGVRGAIQIIAGRLPPGDRDSAIVDEIIARIDALDGLMEDVLLFARPPQARRAPVDVVTLARETSLLVSRDPNAGNVRIEVEGSALPVMVDAKLLNIVLLNLLLNAAHAMQQQGTIRVSVNVDDHVCRIAVADTGPGISPDVRERMFTPFFTTKSRGTGLGLSTAKQLVEAHHGRLFVACPPGGGTIVTIELPS